VPAMKVSTEIPELLAQSTREPLCTRD